MADENVANFMAMTGADEGMAASYLDMCGGHLESAMGLFLDMAGASNMDAGEDTAAAAAVPAITMARTPTAHSILLGAHDTPIPPAWKEQDLKFCESSWGMSQNKNGPCGVLAVLNALALVHAGLPEPTSIASASSSPEQSLLWAIATILQTIARESSTHTVKIASFSSPGSTEIIHTDILLTGVETKSGEVDSSLMDALKSFSLGPGACLLVCYSAILTRGVEQVLEDAKVDGGLPPLIHGPFSICTTELMNLLLFGVARGNVSAYGGMTRTGQKDTWRKSSPVGLLSIDEVESGISLADELKNPSHPIWILHGGDHFTIAWAANTSTKDDEHSLELYHWNGLLPNRRMTRLRLTPATLENLPPAPSSYTPSTYRMELNAVESIVQADPNDKITWPGAWKMHRYELSLVTRHHVEDDMNTPLRPDSVSEPPKYNIDPNNSNVTNNGKWRCASCYRTRYETMCFGENDAALDVCRFCNLARSEAGTTIWVPFKDLDPRTQRSRMMIPKLLTVLRTRWSRANLSLFSSETKSFIPLGETSLSSSFGLPAI